MEHEVASVREKEGQGSGDDFRIGGRRKWILGEWMARMRCNGSGEKCGDWETRPVL